MNSISVTTLSVLGSLLLCPTLHRSSAVSFYYVCECVAVCVCSCQVSYHICHYHALPPVNRGCPGQPCGRHQAALSLTSRSLRCKLHLLPLMLAVCVFLCVFKVGKRGTCVMAHTHFAGPRCCITQASWVNTVLMAGLEILKSESYRRSRGEEGRRVMVPSCHLTHHLL